MKPMTATEVIARQKAHDEYHGPRIQRAAEAFTACFIDPIHKVVEDLELKGFSKSVKTHPKRKHRRRARRKK